MSEAWYVHSVVTDGAGHSIVDTDCMPEGDLRWAVENLGLMYGRTVKPTRFGGRWSRWTFDARLSDGRRITEMIIASRIG